MTSPALDLLRLAAAVAALVLAVAAQGDALVLAALLAIAAWRPGPAVALTAALVAGSWRWGSTSLEALAGAQAVLGPAGMVGPPLAAASAWLAGVALVLCSPGPSTDRFAGPAPVAASRPGRLVATPAGAASRRGPRAGSRPDLTATLSAVAFGAAAATVVAGPAVERSWWVRALAMVVASAGALAVSRLRRSGNRVADVAALLAGAGALALVAPDAPGWAGTVDAGAAGAGAATALAVALMAAVSARAVSAVGIRPVTPILDRSGGPDGATAVDRPA